MALTRLLSSFLPRDELQFQFMSDLHLEINKQYLNFEIVRKAPYLILAGDIGRLIDYEPYRDFLQTQCDQFQTVFLVLGNHEFFDLSREDGLKRAEQLQNEPGMQGRLVVMNRHLTYLEGREPVAILGCTLHSNVPPEAQETVRQKVNDFRRIKGWTVPDHVAEHGRDVAWLEETIRTIRGEDHSRSTPRRILIVTHHAPSTKGTSKPSDEDSPWSSAFATDLLGQQDGSPLDQAQCWIYGHTHYSNENVVGDVRLVSNQRGYVLSTPNAAPQAVSPINPSCRAPA